VKAGPSQESENLGGEKAQESYALGSSLNNSVGWRTPERSKTLKAVRTPRGEGRWKRRTAAREEQSSGGRPQERIRHETRPASSGRMKAPGGCEHLEALAVGKTGPTNHAAAPSGKAL